MKNKVGSFSISQTKRTRLAVVVCLLIKCLTTIPLTAEAIAAEEATLRAAIILKILHQVNWPQKLEKNINFCTDGVSPSIDRLRQLEGKKITQHGAKLHFLTETSGGNEQCHVQIVGAGASESALTNMPLLVICDNCKNNRSGASVELIREKSRIGFNLDLAEAKKKNIRFKIPLMELAKNIRGHHGH
ncbi:YfiR family protein [Teredinibacter haidensis]|uniref:YfiR family protein n=1 Tax=Teredinibacter haidensis TaxID=2731755 RepID=UPI000948E888|nr:YfiR family protein [Teredinibacter haidensis]